MLLEHAIETSGWSEDLLTASLLVQLAYAQAPELLLCFPFRFRAVSDLIPQQSRLTTTLRARRDAKARVL